MGFHGFGTFILGLKMASVFANIVIKKRIIHRQKMGLSQIGL